ncbi:MAG: hypothetical protein U0610_27785 [bacterium]
MPGAGLEPAPSPLSSGDLRFPAGESQFAAEPVNRGKALAGVGFGSIEPSLLGFVDDARRTLQERDRETVEVLLVRLCHYLRRGPASGPGLLPAEPTESSASAPATPSGPDSLVVPQDVRALIELERFVEHIARNGDAERDRDVEPRQMATNRP